MEGNAGDASDASAPNASAPNHLRQRLLRDIHDLQTDPYPGIAIHPREKNIYHICLIVMPPDEAPLHLTMYLPQDYPLQPPLFTMQTDVEHPNVDMDMICVDISAMSNQRGYTPAYTLKGICIQMLSLFANDNIEQDHGHIVNLESWRARMGKGWRIADFLEPNCTACGYKEGQGLPAAKAPQEVTQTNSLRLSAVVPSTLAKIESSGAKRARLADLPAEVLLIVCDHLDDKSLLLARRAWNGFKRAMQEYDVFRNRELQCFILKCGWRKLDLGIGVHIDGRSPQSEFDLLSHTAFERYSVRKSVQGLPFEHWLPLPISQLHWERVRPRVDVCLKTLARSVGSSPEKVIYVFVNDVVVRLSQAAEDDAEAQSKAQPATAGPPWEATKSTLTHASDKAIESYFSLLHLLVCLAAESPAISAEANGLVNDFVAGKRDKQSCPNIGHLLIAVLISGNADQALTKAIINEAITRNVVWMLDATGAGMADLSFLEASEASDYRLQKTFEAGKTSYRLLMFLNLMRKTVLQLDLPVGDSATSTPNATSSKSALPKLRAALFIRHGAPPTGAAATLAAAARKIQAVGSFHEFLQTMDLALPIKANFTKFLRGTLQDSVDKGYSRWALSQEEALYLRLEHEADVQRPQGMKALQVKFGDFSFFPDHKSRAARGGGQADRGRGGRGAGGGRGTRH